MSGYVILYHQQRTPSADLTHWDLMLEKDGTLRTWKIYQEPEADQQLPAKLLPDHRIAYLQYEGPISGDRGHVSQWDQGTFKGAVPADNEPFTVQLQGRIFCGTLTLQPPTANNKDWQVKFPGLTKTNDSPPDRTNQ